MKSKSTSDPEQPAMKIVISGSTAARSLASNATSACMVPLTPHSPVTPVTPYIAVAPVTPVTPVTPADPITQTSPLEQQKDEQQRDLVQEPPPLPTYSLPVALRSAGYTLLSELCETLQGSICKVSSCRNKNLHLIAKITDKSLHERSMAFIGGVTYHNVPENVVREADILRSLTMGQSYCGVVNYVDFFSDERNYFLLMEDAGNNMFQFVRQCHALIRSHRLDIAEWRTFCWRAGRQMVLILDWLHNTRHCCHLDVSLENFSISNLRTNVQACPNADGSVHQKLKFSDDFQIKIIDFGVGQVFTSKGSDGQTDFSSTAYVGKKGYKAPEVHARGGAFDARSADCWSLAVCFFMMFVGSAPFEKAKPDDPLYALLVSGRLVDILQSWGVLHYVSVPECDLLKRLFVEAKYRLTVREIQKHCWFTN